MTPLIALCRCGTVELTAAGAPIASVVCHCEDCQTGARQIESLPNAPRVGQDDGGTGYLVYRKDRVRIARGAERLRAHKIREKTATNRMVATCCNTAMMVTFDGSKHWVDLYRSTVSGAAPPVQMQVCARYRRGGTLDAAVPSFPGYPLRLVAKLIAARIAMLLGD